jgi:RNA polymerase sigma-70 factor (ECF subfamily)
MAPVRRRDPEAEAQDALARGDLRMALTVLMQEYGDDIYRHCRQVVGDDDLADEVHQTVFVQAYRDLPGFTGRSSLRSWLYAIARHRCLDALKITRRWRRRFLAGPTLPDRAAPVVDVETRAELAALGRALEKLKPDVRIAVLLRYQEGLTFEEMADICGERATTLQARVARALPLLRRWMEQGVVRR